MRPFSSPASSSLATALTFVFAFAFSGLAKAATTGGGAEADCACQGLGNAILPSDAEYTNQTKAYWDARANMNPTCVYLPESTQDVASAVKILYDCGSPFAIRGGGHMNFPGSNGITQGVLLSLEKMGNITYNENRKTVEVGPGARWVDVYTALDPFNRYTIGGRLKTIGVPGLTLIGGYHYFINKYGFTMDNVVNYEAVLGNGTIVKASRTLHPELFWGLKGSANNLALVTKFTLKTYPIKYLSTTIRAYPDSEIEPFLDATVDALVNDDADHAGGGIYTISYNATLNAFSASLLGVQEGKESPPSKFAEFESLNSTLVRDAVLRPIAWHNQFETPFQIQRIQFVHHTITPHKKQLRHMYLEWRKAVQKISDVEGLYATFVINLTPKGAIAIGKNNGVGNLWTGSLDEEHLLVWQFATIWTNPADDLRMSSWTQTLSTRLDEENKAKGIANNFIYMGDAGETQNPFQTFFSQKTLTRLRSVRKAYDPDLIFTRKVWGGFKLGY